MIRTRAMAALLALGAVAQAETVRLKATADVWLSDAVAKERNTNSGEHPRLKLKTVQEMAAIRFDASPIRGRQVLEATLLLKPTGQHHLRYIRVSTIRSDWAEGTSPRPYGPPVGATFQYADARDKTPWAWSGSQFCDVIMGSGHSLSTWAEAKERPNGWLAVKLTPELVTALACGDSDGLSVMDGGTPAFYNNYVHSSESRGSAPILEVTLGKRLDAVPKPPVVKAEAATPEGEPALRVTIAPADDVFCWRLRLNGQPVERWRVPHPAPVRPTRFLLGGLPEGEELALGVVAVSRGSAASEPTVLRIAQRDALAAPALPALTEPKTGEDRLEPGGRFRVWACPPLVKIDPKTGRAMHDDLGEDVDYRQGNAVWDSRRVHLFGARGETVSCQLVVTKLGRGALKNITIAPKGFTGPGGAALPARHVELFTNWLAKNKDGTWQPACCVPLPPGAPFAIPDPARTLDGQTTASVTVEVFIPKNAEPGRYNGVIDVTAGGTPDAPGSSVGVGIPVRLEVFDFTLPDRLRFWPELNAYRIPKNAHAYWRLAHEHRCVANYWRWQPRLRGSGKDMQVLWDRYDRDVGPLLSGEAFAGCKRPGQPVEVMYLPFEDSWPTPLTKQTYDYQGYWPKRGDDKKWIVEHYLKAPYIGDALSEGYKAAFLAVQRQFIEHFQAKGWTRTEMQCFYGGKNTHRIQYGSNMWWTTDEPYHWDDWLALQFFCRLWTQGRGDADPRIWAARADISRPQWQGNTLDGIVDAVYYGAGAFTSPPMLRRCRTLARQAPLDLRTYGSANRDTESNTGSVVWCLNAWLNGARAVLPWQTLGSARALDEGDRGAFGGNALIVPGERFGVPVVADLRLKALRDGQQLVEYLMELGERRRLTRAQLRQMVLQAVRVQAGVRAGAALDNADALQFGTLKAWQIAGLRRALARLIVGVPEGSAER